MKPIYALALSLCLLHAMDCNGQEVDPYSIPLVRSAIQLRSKGVYTSTEERHLPRLGDRVGIALAKIYTHDELKQPQTVKLILPVIEEAFSQPASILRDEDREPRVTLLLLIFLESNSRAKEVVADVVRVRQSLNRKAAQ